jgi:hypothetical protein
MVFTTLKRVEFFIQGVIYVKKQTLFQEQYQIKLPAVVMRRISLFILFILLLLNCKESVKDNMNQNQTQGNSTEYTKLSSEKIDGSRTFEVSFTLEKPAECMTIDVESVYLQKSFPVQRIAKKTFFIVEKKLNLPQLKIKSDKSYTPIGRNFNNDWELYSPVKICTVKNDPISKLDVSEYRIRFTAFEKTDFYYVITVTCESKVIFIEYTPAVKNKLSGIILRI